MKSLKEFHNSAALATIRSEVDILTENLDNQEKTIIVKKATSSQHITLCTRYFGRGTDFICLDKTVADNGGVHVIQTFLSEDLSEEIQIQGRAARQDDDGSYSMVLLKQDLEKFGIYDEIIQRMSSNRQKYQILNEKRNELFQDLYEQDLKYLKHSTEIHEYSMQFLANLQQGNMREVAQFLKGQNIGSTQYFGKTKSTTSSRTIVLIDATASMDYLLKKIKMLMPDLFSLIQETLQEQNLDTKYFQMQFAVYRNYNCFKTHLLQYSPWEHKHENLTNWLKGISAQKGSVWSEAIEIGLWHANREHTKQPISQVILIGDAPANSREHAQMMRESAVPGMREQYWSDSVYRTPTYYEEELEKLSQQHIPVHTFYLVKSAKDDFKFISEKTQGICQFLDCSNPTATFQLRDFISGTILANLAGKDQGLKDSLLKKMKNVSGGKQYLGGV